MCTMPFKYSYSTLGGRFASERLRRSPCGNTARARTGTTAHARVWCTAYGYCAADADVKKSY